MQQLVPPGAENTDHRRDRSRRCSVFAQLLFFLQTLTLVRGREGADQGALLNSRGYF